MASPLDTKSASALATLVTFSWGLAPTIVRYARWTSDVVIGGQTFTALPLLEVDYGNQNGGTEDEPAKLTMTSSAEPLPRFRGQRFTPVSALIEECDPRDAAATRRTTWLGRVGDVEFNVDNRPDKARVPLIGLKAQLDRPVGIPITNECQDDLGGPMCRVDLAPLRKTATVVAINKNILTITDAAVLARPALWWNDGTISVDGYEITIRHWESGSSFQMMWPPPREWLNATAVLTPGCNKLIENCRSKYNNESNFTGAGTAMSSRNPQYETSED